jgi:hypothetical protein
MYADRGYSWINLRDQFVTDIIATVNDFQTDGHEVILMMDCNEASGFGTAVDRIMYACNLADAHALDSKTYPPATYHRGSEKIDFVLISVSLVIAVWAAFIMARHDGYLSDHQALLVDFDATSLFLGDTSQVIHTVITMKHAILSDSTQHHHGNQN